MTKSLVLFDFDGTITQSDSLWLFLLKADTPLIVGLKLLRAAPFWFLSKLGVISKDRGKELVLSVFFKGRTKTDLEAYSSNFYKKEIPKILKSNFENYFAFYKEKQCDICLVSASASIYLKHFTQAHNIALLATNLEFKNNQFTGKYDGANCNRREKVLRIQQKYILGNYDKIIAYGDSSGDHEMFQLAHYSKLKPNFSSEAPLW